MTVNYADIHRDIVEKCQKGSRKAQFELYKLYSRAMFNICMRMMNSREEAEDLLQDAFSEAFLKLHTFRFESSFGAWLKRIVVNKCINEIKRRKADLVLTDQFYGGDLAEEETDDKDLQLNVQRVQAAMQQLSDGYRIVFSLYLIEGYDHSEIAEILGVTESTSKSQFLRAKRRIKELLEQ